MRFVEVYSYTELWPHIFIEETKKMKRMLFIISAEWKIVKVMVRNRLYVMNRMQKKALKP